MPHTRAVQRGEHRLGDPAAADQLVEADAVDLDGERVGEPLACRRLVVEQRVHGLHGRDEPCLGGGPVDEVLGEPEVLPGGPHVLDVRPHRAQIADQDAVGLRVARVAVDSALRPAERDVPALRVVVQRLLHGHAPRQPGHLVERAALAHPQPAAAHPTDEPVDHEMALAPGDVIRPGERDQRAGVGHQGLRIRLRTEPSVSIRRGRNHVNAARRGHRNRYPRRRLRRPAAAAARTGP